MTDKQGNSASTIKAPILPKRMMVRGLPDGMLKDHEQYSQFTLSQELWMGQNVDYLWFEQMIFKAADSENTIKRKLLCLVFVSPRIALV